jgi:hypothetical protein
MFNSTVSKYDPRTGRTTRLQNCVPYEQLLARDFSRCCYRTIGPIIPIPLAVSVVVSSSGIPRSFSWTPNGSGTLDYGSGVIPFSSDGNTQLTSTITGPNVKIYSGDLATLRIINQSVLNIDVSGASLLQGLYLMNNSITDINGLNNCPNISEIYLDNNLFTQTSIDSIATDIYATGAVSGFLNIGIQSEFIDPDSPALLQIKNQRQWLVIVP